MAKARVPQEPITAKMREDQERERIIALRMYSFECCLAIEAFETLYKCLRDTYEVLPALQKVPHPYVAEDYTVCDQLDKSGEESMEKIEVTLRGMASDLPRLILATKEMRTDFYVWVRCIREIAMRNFDHDFCATNTDWHLDEIRKDREWLAAREQEVRNG